MKKIILTLLFVFFTFSAFADGHLSKADKEKTIECTGIYYANSMIPQGELELEKIVHSFAAKKFLNSYLLKEGVKEILEKNLPFASGPEILGKELNSSHFFVVSSSYGLP